MTRSTGGPPRTGGDVEHIDDDHVLRVLGRLHGVDLPTGPGGEYLHDLDQVADRLTEFRTD